MKFPKLQNCSCCSSTKLSTQNWREQQPNNVLCIVMSFVKTLRSPQNRPPPPLPIWRPELWFPSFWLQPFQQPQQPSWPSYCRRYPSLTPTNCPVSSANRKIVVLLVTRKVEWSQKIAKITQNQTCGGFGAAAGFFACGGPFVFASSLSSDESDELSAFFWKNSLIYRSSKYGSQSFSSDKLLTLR